MPRKRPAYFRTFNARLEQMRGQVHVRTGGHPGLVPFAGLPGPSDAFKADEIRLVTAGPGDVTAPPES